MFHFDQHAKLTG